MVQQAPASSPIKPPVKTAPASSGKGVFTTFLGICILLLSVATFWVASNRKGRESAIMHPGPSQPTERIIVQKEPTVNPAYATKADVEELFSKLNDRLDKADKRMDVWQHRIWLLGVAHNENVNIRQKMDFQYTGVRDSGYIVFDENWKLNRLPSTMQMDDKQKADLEKSVK
jgi:hypothetical protein